MQLRTCLLTAAALTTAVTFGVAAQQTSNQDAWQAGGERPPGIQQGHASERRRRLGRPL